MNHEDPNPPGWLITFNDLITLLMVFFVLLFAMGNINGHKSEKLVRSLQGALGVLREGKKVGVQIVTPIQSGGAGGPASRMQPQIRIPGFRRRPGMQWMIWPVIPKLRLFKPRRGCLSPFQTAFCFKAASQNCGLKDIRF